MGNKYFSDELPVHKATVDTWIATLIQAKLGVNEWIAPLGADGIVPSQFLPPISLTWGSITGVLADQTDLNTALGSKANTSSPAFNGTPTAPTAVAGTNTLQIATTAFATQLFKNTGLLFTPNAPTQTQGDNTTKVASTAFVQQELGNLTQTAINHTLLATFTADNTWGVLEYTPPTGYDEILIVFQDLCNSSELTYGYFKASSDNGTTWLAINYIQHNGTSVTSRGYNYVFFPSYGVGNQTNEASTGLVRIRDYDKNNRTPYYHEHTALGSTGASISEFCQGNIMSSLPINKIAISSSSNWLRGTIKVYGVKL